MPRALLTLILLATLACSRGPASSQNRGRGVLVIAIDALRYDHTSLGGYDRKTTPRLADFAEQQGINFTQVWSTGPGLLPGHVSLLTGCDPMVARPPKVVLSSGEVQPPIRAWYERLAQHYRLVRYDRRGGGGAGPDPRVALCRERGKTLRRRASGSLRRARAVQHARGEGWERADHDDSRPRDEGRPTA